MKIYIITKDVEPSRIENILKNYAQVKYIPLSREEDIIANCKDAEGLISLYEPITEKVMEELSRLKFISLLSIGFDTIDLDYAEKRGIYVSNNPNYCLEEVADHTVALILGLSRGLFDYNRLVKKQKTWDYNLLKNKIHRLSKQTLGLVGFGKIARKVAKRMAAFATNILAYDPYISKSNKEFPYVKMVDIDELLASSHIISAHIPLNEKTKNFFNKEKFEKMKEGPIFINCSRGGIVNEKDLLGAIKDGLISSVGLDVLSSEEPDLNNCHLLNMDNVILTPHAAFYSEESNEEAQIFAAKHIKYFIEGKLDKIPLIVKGKERNDYNHEA